MLCSLKAHIIFLDFGSPKNKVGVLLYSSNESIFGYYLQAMWILCRDKNPTKVNIGFNKVNNL